MTTSEPSTPRPGSESPTDEVDQDSEPTMNAPEEGRPDGIDAAGEGGEGGEDTAQE